MPTALETLVKILKQERETNCENKTVIGGLGAYADNWFRQASTQAKRPEHVVLAEELMALMRLYDSLAGKNDRLSKINYMLDRITGRVPIPSEYQERLALLRESAAKPEVQPEEKADSAKPSPLPQPAQTTATQAPRSRQTSSTRPTNKREKPEKGDKADKGTPSNHATSSRKPPRERGRSESRELDEFDDDTPRGGMSRRDIRDDSARDMWQYDLRPVERGVMDLKTPPKLTRPPRPPRQRLTLIEAQQRLSELQSPITQLKGIGAKNAEQLKALGIYTVQDMMHYLPRRYDDYTRMALIKSLEPDLLYTVVGKVKFTQTRVGKSGRKDFYVILSDETGELHITFFAMHYLTNKIRVGMTIVVSGKVSLFRNSFQMSNPEWEQLDAESLYEASIVPVYPLSEGVKGRALRRMMHSAVSAWADRMPDYMPHAVLDRTELSGIGWAIRNLHFPESFDHLDHARQRYVFDQLLLMQLVILSGRREWQSEPSLPLSVEETWEDTVRQRLFPYALTGAQQRAIADIRADIAKPVPMNRLIQGDVGSGKTAVAIMAIAMAVSNGKQAALMAPTSILAEQHYRNLSRAFAHYPADQKPVVGLLTSALSTSERQSIYRGLEDGSIDVIVGTHALIQDGVIFKHLALAIVDEQHRFGVGQRAALRGKGYNPHLLVMTATPIPRTLALTLFADLDLSIIDEKPQGRLPIKTRLVLPNMRERMYEFIEAHLSAGRQAFIIHPLVEMSDKSDARSALEAYEELQQVFYRHRVCLLHGRMKPSEKDDIMGAFARHEYDIMVTTTVAEVGVDVPNANIIMIENANRFGLAQLHQLRGRVGRGEHQSFCLLMVDEGLFQREDLLPDNLTPERQDRWNDAQKRVYAMVNSDNGFELAELDWRLRGAGELIGTRQSGAMQFILEEFVTPELVELAQQEAKTLYAEDPDLQQPEHQLLSQRVQMLMNQKGDVS